MDVTLEHNGVVVTILDGPYIENGSPTNAAVEEYTRLIRELERYRQFAADKLLRLYNDTWLDEDIGPVDRARFIAKLVEPSVHLYDEIGAAVIYFEDSGLFAGHSIEVSIDKGVANYANIIG